MNTTGDFYGLPTRVLENRHLWLEFLAEAGPRIVRVGLAGSAENLFAETPDISWSTAAGDYFVRGGHRLWHAPEDRRRTSVPDNAGLVVEPVAGGVRLIQPTEALTGITKQMEIHLPAERPAVIVQHVLQNDGIWPVELAPWAITQLPLGGVAILPQMLKPVDVASLLPNRQLVLWPYTHWQDERLQLYDDYILFQAQPQAAPCKVGYLNRLGWVAYWRAGVLFCKRFAPQVERLHPDSNCNVEVYGDGRCLELETIAPFPRLEPGQAVTHTETWEFYPDRPVVPTLAGVRQLVADLGW